MTHFRRVLPSTQFDCARTLVAAYIWSMEGYEPITSFGEESAEVYDQYSKGSDPAATVAFLKDLARGGPALELAIGTGRIAVPLAAQGVQVDGIDLSTAMVAKLRAKPGGDRLAVTIGDFADVPVPGTYPLIFIVFNTLFNLLTQDDQVRCFENVAAHLAEDGVFVVEAFVPSYLLRLRDDQYVDAEAIGVDEVRWMWVATTPSHSGSTRATSSCRVKASASIRSSLDTPGRASSTSWPASPACD